MRRTPLSQAFVVAFLGAQLLLPIRGFLVDPLDDPGAFSWNMYSRLKHCRPDYRLALEDGSRVQLDPRRYLRRPSQVDRVFYRERLPAFHAYLCETLRKQGARGRLTGRAICTLEGGPPHEMLMRGVDLCSAERQGALERR